MLLYSFDYAGPMLPSHNHIIILNGLHHCFNVGGVFIFKFLIITLSVGLCC